MDDFVGTWALVAYAFSRGDDFPIGNPPNRLALASHLLGREAGPLAPASGRSLTVAPDGRVTQTETDACTGYVYDAEGVETTTGGAFDGVLRPLGDCAYLHATMTPTWATPAGRWLEPLMVRYDDGDTVICDWLMRDGDALLRTISVATDEAYPSRATLRYRRR